MFLVDTNVISEARKGSRANAGVREFWHSTDEVDLYLAVQTIGEIRCGLEKIRQRGDLAQAKKLESWLYVITTDYADRILDFDLDCAQVWGKLMSANAHHPIDKQIAAIALIYNLSVVTRNTKDFKGLGVRLVNPFR